MKRCLAVLVCVLGNLSSLADPAQALPGRTLEECVAIALERHPRLGSARAQVDAGHQRVRQNVSFYLPQIDGGGSVSRRKRSAAQATGLPGAGGGGGSPAPFTYYSTDLSLSQILFDFGRNLDAIQASRAREDSLMADAVTQQEVIARAVKQAYFDLLAARRLREVADEVLRSNQRQLEQASGRYDVGFATKLDVTRSEVLVANAELDLLTASNAVLVGEQTLRNAMGLTEPLDFEPIDVLEAQPFAMEEEHALAIALENRSELASVRALRRAAQEDVSARWKEHLPDLGAAANIDWSGSNSLDDSWNLAAIVSVPIFSGGLIDARVGEARANALALSFEEQALAQDVALEVRRAVLETNRAREAIGVSERARTQARENLELAEGRYEAGVGNVIELVDAQVQRASAEAEYVRSLYAFQTAVAELERAIGQEVARQ